MAFKYLQLAAKLQAEISRGVFQDKLPTEMELCAACGFSRQTVRQALDHLAELGLIERRQGSGSYVRLQALRSGHIALVTTYIDDYIFPAVLRDIQAVLANRNYSTMLYATQNSVERERQILQHLLQQPVDGLIVEGTKTALPNPNLDLYEKLSLANTPVVFIHGWYRDLKNSVSVTDNDFDGGYMLARHLITTGHTKIAGIFKSDDIQGHQRYFGYLSAMRDAGLPLQDNQVYWYTTEDRRYLLDYSHTAFLDHFFHSRLKDCTAVICYNDEVADQLIRLLLKKGKKVPGDVAVVSFDNSHYSELCPVRITSLMHEPSKLGMLAANILLDRIDGKPVTSQQISWRLIHKESG